MHSMERRFQSKERVLGALHVSDENNSNMYAIMYAQECNELLGGGYKYLDVRCPDEIAQGAPYDSVFLVCSLCVPCVFLVCSLCVPCVSHEIALNTKP